MVALKPCNRVSAQMTVQELRNVSYYQVVFF